VVATNIICLAVPHAYHSLLRIVIAAGTVQLLQVKRSKYFMQVRSFLQQRVQYSPVLVQVNNSTARDQYFSVQKYNCTSNATQDK
jgi:hypothetical protein